MSDLWRQCEGQLVDNKYPLLRFLANTNHSAVFLIELRQPQPRSAALKFISADIPAPEQQLAIWQRAAQLSHPNLLQIYHSGRCRLAGMDLLYVIMEHADENLAQFLPKRALNSQETRDVLEPLVEALSYLHRQGFAHSHVKPSNLLAIADHLKLSSDTLLPMNDSRESYRDHDIYDAPENSGVSTISASAPADIWSLGVTLVETLTQQAPPLPFDDSAEPVLAESMPQPFLELARHSLVRDPARRWTIAEIATHLNPALLAAAAAAGVSSAPSPTSLPTESPVPSPTPTPTPAFHPARVSPTSVPISTEPAVPLAKLQMPTPLSSRRIVQTLPEKTIAFPSYLVPVMLGIVLILGAIFTLPKIFRSLPKQSASTASNSDSGASIANAKPFPTNPTPTSPSTPAPDQNPPKAAVEPKVSPETNRPARTASPAPEVRSASSADHGEVLDQVLPEASQKALSTIQGTVRVAVRLQVDPAGKVSSAELESPGPSKYFADLALNAAQKWEFTSPVSDGHSLPSQWLVRFEFSRTGVVAVPVQQVP